MQTIKKKFSIFFENILQIIDHYDIKSINEFAIKHLGYTAAEKINRLKDINAKPSFDIIVDITNKFEEIDANWLLTGNGPMIKGERHTPLEVEIDRLADVEKILVDQIRENYRLKSDIEKLHKEISALKKNK